MTEATEKKNLLDILQTLWDRKAIGKWSSSSQMREKACADGYDGEHQIEWFDEYLDYLKSVLHHKKVEDIQAAVKVLFDEVNGGDADILVEAIGRQHKYLLDEFAKITLRAINEYGRMGGDGPFDGRISPFLVDTINQYLPPPKKKGDSHE